MNPAAKCPVKHSRSRRIPLGGRRLKNDDDHNKNRVSDSKAWLPSAGNSGRWQRLTSRSPSASRSVDCCCRSLPSASSRWKVRSRPLNSTTDAIARADNQRAMFYTHKETWYE
jgi:hypothetical protein